VDSDTVWQHIDAERLWMADFLESLPAEDWQRPSLCAGGTVRDVGAHVTFARRRCETSCGRRCARGSGTT
jgi:hypothetical protein